MHILPYSIACVNGQHAVCRDSPCAASAETEREQRAEKRGGVVRIVEAEALADKPCACELGHGPPLVLALVVASTEIDKNLIEVRR